MLDLGRHKEEGVDIRDRVRLRNSISRGGTGGDDGSTELFEVPYSTLTRGDAGLTLFARGSTRGLDILTESLEMLARTGYGADASVGHGAFRVNGGPSTCPALDDVPHSNGFVSLSTYQPAPSDPIDGNWQAFVKYGKMAPEFHDSVVFKRPQIMIKPGACFRTSGPPQSFCGGPIRPEDLLDDADCKVLAQRGVRPIQGAFGLAVPMRWPNREEDG